MQHNNLIKKGLGVLFCTVMAVYGIAAGSHGIGTAMIVQAETGSSQKPDATKFATVEQLTDNCIFSLYNDGTNTAAIAQKVYFGRDSTAKKQTWYIAGYDGNGLVLMCDPKRPLAGAQEFLPENDDSVRSEGDGTIEEMVWYNKELYNGESVYANHYGASQLRTCLRGLENNSTHFNSAELELMESVTIYTRNAVDGTAYPTNDRLYAAYGAFGENYITVGANDPDDLNGGIKIGLSGTVVSSGSPYADKENRYFWLRAPLNDYTGASVLVEEADNEQLIIANVDFYANNYAVTPAFDLDLSPVLFASAAPAVTASGSFEDTMTFRLDAGNGADAKIRSTATYSESGITVEKDSSDSSLYLYVQGKDGNGDWLYSVEVTGSGENHFALSAIHNGADLSKCRIWLETADNGTNLTYAKMAEIPLVEITDIDAPAAGTELDTTAACGTVGVKTGNDDFVAVGYTESGAAVSGQAGYFKEYTAEIVLEAEKGYTFAGTTAAKVNGKDAALFYDAGSGKLTVSYTFDRTETAVISSVEITDITAPEGGQPFDTEAVCAAEGIATTRPKVSYTVSNEAAAENDTAEDAAVTGNVNFHTDYTASVTLAPDTGYVFWDGITVSNVTINGEEAANVTLNANGTLTASCNFTVPMAKLLSIAWPNSIRAENGAARTAEALGLPEEVTIETEDPSVTDAEVSWNLDDLTEAAYDPSDPEEQEFTVEGTAKLPEGIDQNDVPLTVTVQVRVTAAEKSAAAEGPAVSEATTVQDGSGKPTESPDTGDHALLIVLILMLIGGGTGLTGFYIMKRSGDRLIK